MSMPDIEVSVRAGRTIVERGVRGDALYLILKGEAKVYRSVVPTGRSIARLGPGDFFGEMARRNRPRESAARQ
jgi:CRP-like cAMP-binding protein